MKTCWPNKYLTVFVVIQLLLAPIVLRSQAQSAADLGTGSPEAAANVYPGIQAAKVVVLDGTEVELELKTAIYAKTAEVGDQVDFTVVLPVKVDGRTVIARGAPA